MLVYIWFIRPKALWNASFKQCTLSSNCFEMTHEVLSQFLSLQLKSTSNQTKMSDSHSPAQTPHFSTFFVGASIFSLHFKHSAYRIIFVLNCFSFFLLTNFVWWWKLRAISLNKLNFIVFYLSFRRKEKRDVRRPSWNSIKWHKHKKWAFSCSQVAVAFIRSVYK